MLVSLLLQCLIPQSGTLGSGNSQKAGEVFLLLFSLKVYMNMDDGVHRENGRHRTDHYRSVHTQWMMPQHQMKDHHTIKLMAIVAERDSAIQERNLALSEKKVALAERDMAMVQHDAAVTERNNAIIERDNAIAALKFARQNMNGNGGNRCPDIHSSPLQLSDAPYDHTRGMHISEALPLSIAPESGLKARRSKQLRKEAKAQAVPSKNASKLPRKRRGDGEDLNQQVIIRAGEDRSKHVSVWKHREWKDQELSLNQVAFDESTMPAPVCSCTGKFRQCYKWGNGGWQSSCCTTKLSEYPLPMILNKPHARVGGRKMSGSAFAKLLARLAAEGHDLSMPVDLKEHWAKHGTNRYITIK